MTGLAGRAFIAMLAAGLSVPLLAAQRGADEHWGMVNQYCVSCHKEFGTEGGVLADKSGIDTYAAKGPAATNTSMPEGDTKPTDAEREMLGQYLACQP